MGIYDVPIFWVQTGACAVSANQALSPPPSKRALGQGYNILLYSLNPYWVGDIHHPSLPHVKPSYLYYNSNIVISFTVAIRRLYENQRRTFLNCQPQNVERAQHADVKKKYRARRERVSANELQHV